MVASYDDFVEKGASQRAIVTRLRAQMKRLRLFPEDGSGGVRYVWRREGRPDVHIDPDADLGVPSTPEEHDRVQAQRLVAHAISLEQRLRPTARERMASAREQQRMARRTPTVAGLLDAPDTADAVRAAAHGTSGTRTLSELRDYLRSFPTVRPGTPQYREFIRAEHAERLLAERLRRRGTAVGDFRR